MIRLVSDNPVPRIAEVDDEVALTFETLASGILEMLAGQGGDDLSDAALAFRKACERSKEKIKDPNGVLIRCPDLNARGIEDDAINGVLRGALRQVAAMLVDGISGERYEAARAEITAGIVGFNKAVASRGKKVK